MGALGHLPVSYTVKVFGDKKGGHYKDMQGLVGQVGQASLSPSLSD